MVACNEGASIDARRLAFGRLVGGRVRASSRHRQCRFLAALKGRGEEFSRATASVAGDPHEPRREHRVLLLICRPGASARSAGGGGGEGAGMGRRAGLGRTGLPGSWCASWRVIRTSNAYVFRDPKPGLRGGFLCKSENPIGTLDQEILSLEPAPARDPAPWSVPWPVSARHLAAKKTTSKTRRARPEPLNRGPVAG